MKNTALRIFIVLLLTLALFVVSCEGNQNNKGDTTTEDVQPGENSSAQDDAGETESESRVKVDGVDFPEEGIEFPEVPV